MKATYRNHNLDNLAIGGTAWTLDLEAAKAVRKRLKEAKWCGAGQYWGDKIGKPTANAIREGRPTISVWTSGFSTAGLSSMLHLVGAMIERLPSTE